MDTIIFVTGAAGTGKTSFIEKKYQDENTHCVLDLAKISMKLFGSFDALEDDDRIIDIYNEATGMGTEALVDNKILVVEYYLDEKYDDDFLSLVQEAKLLGIRVSLQHFQLNKPEAMRRVESAKLAGNYYSSEHLRQDILEIMSGILETYAINQTLERICEVGAEGGSLRFFRIENGGRENFFFCTNETAMFDFEPDLELEKITGIDYVKRFETFEEAFSAMLGQYPVFELYPLEVNKKYVKIFNQVYQSYLKTNKAVIIHADQWEMHLN